MENKYIKHSELMKIVRAAKAQGQLVKRINHDINGITATYFVNGLEFKKVSSLEWKQISITENCTPQQKQNITAAKELIKDMFKNGIGYKEFNDSLYVTLGAIEEHDGESYCFTYFDKINIYVDENANLIYGDRVTAEGWEDLEPETAKEAYIIILDLVGQIIRA